MEDLDFLYDPKLFERVSHLLTGELTRYLGESREPACSVAEPEAPERLIEKAEAFLARGDESHPSADEVVTRAQSLVREFLSSTTRLQSPNYMGHQVNPPVPVAGAMTILSGVMNPGLAVYEMSRFAAAIERSLIARLGVRVGWKPGDFDGVITSGGTLANMTALLTARNWKYPKAWSEGVVGKRPAILAGADSHYSIARAAGVMGLGIDQVIKVPLDASRRLDVSRLEETYQKAVASGLDPFCIIGASGTTPVGAFDPLLRIARFAKEKSLWFHVDAAHGGSLLLSEKHRGLLDGIAEADSIAWDAHKMMFVPSLCTFLLYRDKKTSYLPFQQEAPYLFSVEDETRMAVDSGLRTFECTKGAIALPVWSMWAMFGEKIFGRLIDKTIGTTKLFHDLIAETGDFVPIHRPEANILCFRYVPEKMKKAPLAELGAFQKSVRDKLVADGRFYITGSAFDGIYCLRVTIINPSTGREEILALLDHIRSKG